MELQLNGRTVYAYTGGKAFDPTLPCIVFLHGALHDHSVWTLLARWFAHHGHAVLAPDLPGHMRSDGPPLPDVESLAEWTLSLIRQAGASRAMLVGHSMGSLIALEAAARSAERVGKLALVCSAVPMNVSPPLLTTAADDPQRAIEMIVAYSYSTLAAKPSYPGPGTWTRGGGRALMRLVQSRQRSVNLLHHDFSVCHGYRRGLEAAALVRCPTTVVIGEHDQMTAPRQVQGLLDVLSATVHRLPSGHIPMAEAPDALLLALRRWTAD